MAGISVSLPLSTDPDDGLKLNKDLKDVVFQNFKNLLLTIPGERIMIPDFGVGLSKFLFETDNPGLRSEIISAVHSQVNKYLPYIQILNIFFESSHHNPNIDINLLKMRIEFLITPLGYVDSINVGTQDNNVIVTRQN